MTSISIIRQRDSVSLITDGLVHGATGVQNKTFTLPHLNLAIASTGAAGAGIMIAAEANQATSFDDLRDSIGELMRHCERNYRSHMGDDYELHIAGIGSDGPDFFYAVNHKRRHGIEPYEAISAPGSVSVQPCTEAIMTDVWAPWRGRLVEDLDPIEEGPRIVGIQRQHLNKSFPDQIGGLCSVTTITLDGISQRIAKRWPLDLGWENAACR